MSRTVITSLIIALSLAAAGFGVATTRALEAPLSDAHIEQIESHCVAAQTSLSRLHASDGLMRVNRGQLYESISTKLMAPLNSRLVLNRVDTLNLLPLAANYEQQLKSFRSSYQQYEVAMSRILSMNCQKQPAEFYRGVVDTRTKRETTHKYSKELQQTIVEYGEEFSVFAEGYSENKS